MFALCIFLGNGTNMCPDPVFETEPASLHVIEYILVIRWQLQHQNLHKKSSDQKMCFWCPTVAAQRVYL